MRDAMGHPAFTFLLGMGVGAMLVVLVPRASQRLSQRWFWLLGVVVCLLGILRFAYALSPGEVDTTALLGFDLLFALVFLVFGLWSLKRLVEGVKGETRSLSHICKECGYRISRNAKQCPHCGEPTPVKAVPAGSK